MTTIVIEIVIIQLLLLANGVFAMTEMAVVSARKAKLKRRSDAGDAGARVALELAESPNRFLPTVQIGITLVGLLAAAFGGNTVAEQIAQKAATVSEEEVKLLLQEGMEAGVFHAAEPARVESVLAFDRRPVQDIMTPREKLVFLNRDDSHEAVWHKIVVSAHSHFPLAP